jgi:hypothetical protein
VLGLIVISAIGFSFYKLFSRPKEIGPAKMTALTTGGKINGEDINGQVSISPDGKYVVCAANDSKQQASLWIRQISTSSLVRIVPPENGGYFGTTFSPDGELVYYVATLEKNKFVPTLYRVPALGGTPQDSRSRLQSGRVLARRIAVRFRPPQSERHGLDGGEHRWQRRTADDRRCQTAEWFLYCRPVVVS